MEACYCNVHDDPQMNGKHAEYCTLIERQRLKIIELEALAASMIETNKRYRNCECGVMACKGAH